MLKLKYVKEGPKTNIFCAEGRSVSLFLAEIYCVKDGNFKP